MIFDPTAEIVRLEELLDVKMTPEQVMLVSMVLITMFDHGMASEQKRIIGLLQADQNVINVREVVRRIRKPLR